MRRLLVLAVLVPSTASAARALKPDDFASLRVVGEPQLSPDGTRVVYTVSTTDLAKDKTYDNLWIAQRDGSENRALTSGATKQSHPRWSPDGNRSRSCPRAATTTRTISCGSCLPPAARR